MNNFGFMIIRNPGPTTRVEYGGLLGEGYGLEDTFATASAAWEAALATAAPGDLVHLLAVWDEGRTPQLTAYLSPDEVDEGPSDE